MIDKLSNDIGTVSGPTSGGHRAAAVQGRIEAQIGTIEGLNAAISAILAEIAALSPPARGADDDDEAFQKALAEFQRKLDALNQKLQGACGKLAKAQAELNRLQSQELPAAEREDAEQLQKALQAMQQRIQEALARMQERAQQDTMAREAELQVFELLFKAEATDDPAFTAAVKGFGLFLTSVGPHGSPFNGLAPLVSGLLGGPNDTEAPLATVSAMTLDNDPPAPGSAALAPDGRPLGISESAWQSLTPEHQQEMLAQLETLRQTAAADEPEADGAKNNPLDLTRYRILDPAAPDFKALLESTYTKTTLTAWENIEVWWAGVRGDVAKMGKEAEETDLKDPALMIGENVDAETVSYTESKHVELYGEGGPSFLDVEQGQVGDCWFLSSLATVAAQRPDVIEEMIQDNRDGTYSVRFYEQDAESGRYEEVWVTVDDDLPRYNWADDDEVYAEARDSDLDGREEIWVGIVEKAFAQFYQDHRPSPPDEPEAGYQSIHADHPTLALEALLGAPSTSERTADVSDDELWEILCGANQPAGESIVASSLYFEEGKEEEEEAFEAMGYVPNHAYTVLQAVETGEERYVILYNPHGIGEPGDPRGGDGFFKVTLEEFCENFRKCSCAKAGKSLTETAAPREEKSGTDTAPKGGKFDTDTAAPKQGKSGTNTPP